MGGSAVLQALVHVENVDVDAVVILAATGPAVKRADIRKLFAVSQGDRLSPRVKEVFEASSEPKELRILPGEAHAQHMFNTAHAEELMEAIVEFLGK